LPSATEAADSSRTKSVWNDKFRSYGSYGIGKGVARPSTLYVRRFLACRLRGALGAGGVGKAVDLSIDLFAQIPPDILRHGEEYLDHLGIELPP